MEQRSNYETLCLRWAEQLKRYDTAHLLSLLPELRPDGDSLTIVHFGRTFRIDRDSGLITALDGKPATIYERLNIYTLL